MAEQKWTPAPWQVDDIGTDEIEIVADTTPIAIVEVYDDASQANANLIAASPDLAECVRKAEQLAKIADDWHLPEVEIDGVKVLTLDLAAEFRAALAKAKGQK